MLKRQRKDRRLRKSVRQKVRFGLAFVLLAGVALYAWKNYSADNIPDDEFAGELTLPPRRRLLPDPELTKEKNQYPRDFFTDESLRQGAFLFHFLGMLYMFTAIAIVCDEFFVPALEEIVDTLDIPHDVAGATFMAAGGSAPELATNFIGVFVSKSSVGFGTVVGSAVFNVLFVIGMCALFQKDEVHGLLKLTWWPFARDVVYYAFSLGMLAIFFGVVTKNQIQLYESLILFGMYFGYVTLMYFNSRLHHWVLTKVLKRPEEETEQKPLVKFRVGLLNFMGATKDSTWIDMVGAFLVEKIAGTVEKAFDKLDEDNNGYLDKEELKGALKNLGIISDSMLEKDVSDLMRGADENTDGKVSKEEFTKWYMTTKAQTKDRVSRIFDRYDTDNNGYIDRQEFGELLAAISPTGVTIPPDVQERALNEMAQGPSVDGDVAISEAAFTAWYNDQMFSNHVRKAKKKDDEDPEDPEGGGVLDRRLSLSKDGKAIIMQEEDEDEDSDNEPINLAFPSEAGCLAKISWCLTIPILIPLWLTLFDVRNPAYKKWYPYTFGVSILWLGFCSYMMVWWATVVGWSCDIPSQVMGLTFIAAGTSVPDLLTSVIVARQGHGDMAVSSSIGSNIFDVTVCLPLPWLCWSLGNNIEPYAVVATNLDQSIVVLLAMLIMVFISIVYNKWVMTKCMGSFMFVLYAIFVMQDLFTTYNVW